MDEQDWIILKVLFEKKNITKTAESLYISQPSLTKKIQQIETEYQVEIVKRGTKGVHFTPVGEYLAQCAVEMLSRLQQIKDTVSNMSEEVSGTLRLGVSNYITRHKLPPLLKLFLEQFPKVNYKVTTGWSRDAFQLVYNGDVHIGMVRGDYQWADSKILLFEENLCVASLEKMELRDLPSLPRIDYETDALLKTMIDHWWSGEFAKPPFIGMEVDKADTCTEMVLNGLGYGILPSVLLQEHPHLHRIILKDKNGDPIVRRTWMFYHEKSLETKLIREFVEFVKKLDFTSTI
ncbi:LysR family transcriptional regulator [Bacillus sp. SORGH_AS_0510]|uniref:LysR family transcriptional regulator n=1 Tax=Bacillus sp. SORGH_AS_0510 TaxID=3041771 RepID=UPI0027D92834|nr:LysR family transcriptional regulator [Bacillus sp. SORGH_AS_0510]